MPKRIGECKAAYQRYFYDTETNECKLFIYGGCRGNENNFQYKDICEDKCLQGKKKLYKTTVNFRTTTSLIYFNNLLKNVMINTLLKIPLYFTYRNPTNSNCYYKHKEGNLNKVSI